MHKQRCNNILLVIFLVATKAYALPADDNLSENKNIIFVDPAVKDYGELITETPLKTEIIILNPSHDGIQQIARYLSSYQELDSIHIISHGHYGKMTLGSSSLDYNNLEKYQVELQSWGNALSDNRGLLINSIVGSESGTSFVDHPPVVNRS